MSTTVTTGISKQAFGPSRGTPESSGHIVCLQRPFLAEKLHSGLPGSVQAMPACAKTIQSRALGVASFVLRTGRFLRFFLICVGRGRTCTY